MFVLYLHSKTILFDKFGGKMKIKYLGTAAAEGVPGLFCGCETCREARRRGGKNIRTRSQAIVDDKILIDFPQDTYFHVVSNNIPLYDIKVCLITHSHDDHLYAPDFNMRSKKFAKTNDDTPLCVYSDKSGYKITNNIIKSKKIDESILKTCLAEPLQKFEAQGYEITPLRALHDESTTPLLYIIEKDGKSIFYANDTSGIEDEAFKYLKTLKKPLNLVSFDCTFANNPEYKPGRHMNLLKCAEEKQRLLQIGAADKNTVFVLNHFSHNGKDVLYEDFSKIAKQYGFEVSFDGMEIEV